MKLFFFYFRTSKVSLVVLRNIWGILFTFLSLVPLFRFELLLRLCCVCICVFGDLHRVVFLGSFLPCSAEKENKITIRIRIIHINNFLTKHFIIATPPPFIHSFPLGITKQNCQFQL